MRKKFVYVVFVPFIVLLVVLYVFLDSWVESGLELAGEAAVGARVEIDHLHLTLSPLGMEFARLQVANARDPWKNLFETGKTRFALDLGQLLRGKYVIETMEISDLILGTKRTTDGSLPKKPEPPPREQAAPATEPSLSQEASTLVKEKKKSAPVFDLQKLRKQFNVDSLLNVQNLRSVQHIDSLKTEVQQASREWQAALADVEKSKQRINEVAASLKTINVSQLKSVQSIAAALKTVSDAQKGIAEVSATYNSRKTSVTQTVNGLASSIREIDPLVREDYRNLLDLARLPDVSMKGLAEMLLGQDALNKANDVLHWVDLAHSKIQNSSSTPPEANPPRLKGQNIAFPVEHAAPKFWIKKIHISGGTDKAQEPDYFYATGEILNVSSNQRVTGLPITADLSATEGRGTRATFKATIDRRTDPPVDTYDASLTGVPVAAMQIGRPDFVPATISNASLAVSASATVPGNRFDADARVGFTGLKVSFSKPPRTTVERIVRDVLSGIQGFTMRLRLWKKDGPLDVALETDLDNLLAERTRKVIGDEVNRLRAELKQKLDRKVAEKRQELERLFNQKKGEVDAKIKEYEKVVQDVQNKRKELEDKINAEKKKQEESLKKKGVDALKNIFKKK